MIKEDNSPREVVPQTPETINLTDNEPRVTVPEPLPEVVEKPVATENVVVEVVVPKKEPSPVYEVPVVADEPTNLVKADVDMTEVVPIEPKVELKVEKSKPQPMNGDVAKVSDE